MERILSAQAIPWTFLAVSVVGVAFTLSALLRGRKLFVFIVPYFFGAWLTGELALHHLAWQVVATVVFLAWGALESWPGLLGLAITLASWMGLWALHRRGMDAVASFERSLRDGLGEAYPEVEPLPQQAPLHQWLRPFHLRQPGVERIADLAYADGGKRNRLDVFRSRVPSEGRPILLQIHGGAWVISQKEHQGQPLMNELALRGWLCVAPNYRLSPQATFPDHLIDVKRALAWIREHAAAYGGDPRFVAVTGGSAGGHLASMLALTANDPEYQPGFEEVDTSVSACVPLYGVYDLLDRHGYRGLQSPVPFFERVLMKCSPEEQRERWERASPTSRVHADAPPFLVIHGTHDSFAFVEDAREFVRALRDVSRKPVVYAELPGAQHAFDVFHSPRSRHAVNATARFLEYVRSASQARLNLESSPKERQA